MRRLHPSLPVALLALGASLFLPACSSDTPPPAGEETGEAAPPETPAVSPAEITTEAPTEAPAADPVADAYDGPDPLPPPDPAITKEALEHHVRFLASDEHLGRAPGSPELARVRDYLVRALKRAGVQPAGDDGTYLQRVPLARWHHTKPPELILRGTEGEEYFPIYGVDFDVKQSGFGEPKSCGELPLRTVRSPDDLPDEVPDKEAIWIRAENRDAEAWVAAKGYRVRDWPLQIHARGPFPGKELEAPPAELEFDDPALDFGNWLALRGELREILTSGRIATIDLRFFTEKEVVEDYNVIGILPGSAPPISRKAVVLSAHVDAPGTLPGYDPKRPTGRDMIKNGADGNASGVAALLEIAEAIAAGEPPPYTTVVLFTCLGTRLMLGGRYYIEYPVVPLADTILNLHLDMLGRPDARYGKPGRLWVSGSDRTNLQGAWFALDLQATQDMRPKHNYFQTRGNWVFAERNIPAHTLTSFGDHDDLYSIRDEADTLDYEHFTAVTKTCLRAAMSVLDRTVSPAWRR